MFPIAVALVAALSSAPTSLPYSDVRTTDAQGREVIIRSSKFPDFLGGTVVVEQRLRPLGGGRFEIDPKDQSRATQLYHQANCEEVGMRPHDVVGTLSGDLAIGGFTCIADEPVDGQPLSDEELEMLRKQSRVGGDESRASDYVIATPPSGSTPAGINFYGKGRVLLVGSVLGEVTYAISIDNRRCYWGSREYPSRAPFRVSVEHGVTCIGHRPGFLRTSSEGCVPKICGKAGGTWSISEPRPKRGLEMR